ncbi:MAG: UDP-glucose/GDP-mannose dehydrogenase family protein [Actinomycetota bacterium]|nr:UDP-glucose/GDP-mannose dehydrogenase family protein [Actinomycetota bacterium]
MTLRATVIGTGYLGATHAACLAESGCEVMGVDTNPETVAALAGGSVPFYEPHLPDLVGRHVSTGRLRFTTSFVEAADHGDVHFVCVGTPQSRDGLGADLDQIESAVDALAPHLRRQCVVVGKSTVPVGTAESLSGRLAAAAPAGGDVDLAWNPEFLREGHAVADSLQPDRIVIGVRSEIAEKVLRDVYAPQLDNGVPLVVTDVATAELVKVAANAFLATKISFMNAMAELCEQSGADVIALADAIGRDERIGGRYLNAGLGFGGGCLPKDIRALMASAGELGVTQAVTFLREVDAINMRRRTRMVNLAQTACESSVLGKRIGVLGAAFKPDSDDVRDSPALNVAAQLHLQGATVTVYDPAARAKAQQLFPTLQYATSVDEAAYRANVLLHLTEWEEFREMDPHRLDDVVSDRRIIDGRNALDAQRWRQAGWTYRALGRP